MKKGIVARFNTPFQIYFATTGRKFCYLATELKLGGVKGCVMLNNRMLNFVDFKRNCAFYVFM